MSGLRLAAASRLAKSIQQRASHADLSSDVSQYPAPSIRSTKGRLDAIIVPASRPASFLQPAIELAAYFGMFLVVLCSKHTRVEQVARRVARTPRARALIVPIPEGWVHSGFPTRTSAETFKEPNAHRVSDLSAKRNLSLLLARLRGWNKIAFVDDDITLSRTDNIPRLAGQLDDHQVAGMRVRRFPDNSVVCHARRLAGFDQDVFVTGAVLGVHCNSLPLSFFPDIYNEDWFFFADEAATRSLPRVGHAMQAEYDPFDHPGRARSEEFGDLLAEGLYAWIGGNDPDVPFDEQLCGATTSYWSRFIDARHELIAETKSELSRFTDPAASGFVSDAVNSLTAAENQLDTITADLCVNFVEAWRDDRAQWQRFSNTVSNVDSVRAAMNLLELRNWTLAEFGVVVDYEESLLIDSTVTYVPRSNLRRRSNRPPVSKG
jgi:hypothetical protein